MRNISVTRSAARSFSVKDFVGLSRGTGGTRDPRSMGCGLSKRLEDVDIDPLPEPDSIVRCRGEVSRARMEPGVQHYAVDLVRRTRTHPFIHYGASPRASVALLLCSKALAAIRGRDFATPDDVRDVATVLRHRLTLR